MADSWYYSAGGAQNGPFTPDQIGGLLRDRTIDRDTYVWSPAMSDWAPLAQTELASFLGAPSRPPMVSPAPPPPAAGARGPIAAGFGGGTAGGFDLGAMEQGSGFPGIMLRAARRALQFKYIDFQGRANRPEFWWYELFVFLLLIVAAIVDAIVRKILGFGFVSLLLELALFLPGLSASIRRLHDTNRSGWWTLISLVPFVGAIALLVFLCLPSDAGDNRFGPPSQPV